MLRRTRRKTARELYSGLLDALVQVMGTSNGYLFHHGPRVALLSHDIGLEMGLSRDELARVFFGGMLMDLGMIGLVEDAWENPVPVLSPAVRRVLEEHPGRGAEILVSIPHLESVAPLVRAHHEWWDGSGYPDGLTGDEIPPGARILRLADTVCALGEERPYRAPLDPSAIVVEVRRGRGAEFAPDVVRAFEMLVRPMDGRLHGARARGLLLSAADDLLPDAVPEVSAEQLLDVFSSLVDAKDPYTGGHSRRVAVLAEALAAQLGFDPSLQRSARAAGYLHDLGKVSIPLRILKKAGLLDRAERLEIRRHPVTGARILGSIPSLSHLRSACRHHHERWDGGGYPDGLARDGIPLMAQILAVCDSYDAMTSGRAYRACRSHVGALEEIDREAGSQFGPRPARAFLNLPYEVFSSVSRDEPFNPLQDRPFRSPFRPREVLRRSRPPWARS